MVTVPLVYLTEPLWFYVLLGAFLVFMLVEAAKLGYKLFEMAKVLLAFVGL